VKIINAVTIVLALVLAVSVAAIWATSSVQDFMDANTNWNGIKNLYQHFKITGVTQLSELDGASSSDTLLVIPYLPYTQDELAGLGGFVRRGGTIILMDDFGFGNKLLEQFGLEARFSGQLLLDPLFCDRNPLLPRVSIFSDESLGHGIHLVTLNRPTVLSVAADDKVLAWSSPSSFLDNNRNGIQDTDEPAGSMALAATYTLGEGTLVLVSDPSIAINTMLALGDNLAFMNYLLSQGESSGEVLLDRAHLVESTLDVSKTRLLVLKENLSKPHALVGVVALVILVVSLNAVEKGNTNG
jgi:hypothetical protein